MSARKSCNDLNLDWLNFDGLAGSIKIPPSQNFALYGTMGYIILSCHLSSDAPINQPDIRNQLISHI